MSPFGKEYGNKTPGENVVISALWGLTDFMVHNKCLLAKSMYCKDRAHTSIIRSLAEQGNYGFDNDE